MIYKIRHRKRKIEPHEHYRPRSKLRCSVRVASSCFTWVFILLHFCAPSSRDVILFENITMHSKYLISTTYMSVISSDIWSFINVDINFKQINAIFVISHSLHISQD